MRLLSIIVGIFFAAGCTRTPSEPAPVDPVMSSPWPAPPRWPAPTADLYTDEEIQKLAKFDIEGGLAPFILDIPCLDVVPDGESYPREKVFKMLKIDDKRIRDFRQTGCMAVVFLAWQVSPSFDICCMTAINDQENDGVGMIDPNRKVYGIRLIKRRK